MARPRLVALDAIKGMAIFLVVVGHIVARDMPAGDTWFAAVKETIYRFHMPLFMFVTGLIYGYGRKPLHNLGDYRRFAWQKTRRLVPAWLLFAVLVFLGKYVGGFFLPVDNQVTGFSDIFKVLTAPRLSFATFLWYIYVIYIYYLLEPVIYRLTRGHIVYFLPLSLLCGFIPAPVTLGADILLEFSFVFFLGVTCGDQYPAFLRFIRRGGVVFCVLFVAVLLFAPPFPGHLDKLVTGLLSIGAFAWFAEFSFIKNNGQIQLYATYTFAIYLMNTMCIGLVKAVLLRFLAWDNAGFIVMAPCLVIGGLYLPILIRRHLISRSRVLSTIVA